MIKIVITPVEHKFSSKNTLPHLLLSIAMKHQVRSPENKNRWTDGEEKTVTEVQTIKQTDDHFTIPSNKSRDPIS